MSVLGHLQPQAVFSYFEQLCAIPHGSGNTKAVSDWLMDFARARGLAARQDTLNNVIIVKPAAPGYEQAPTLMLQGHMDMVCEKAPDCPKDMTREGLDLAVEGDHIFAKGTTLGGDDGIAVTMMLAILDAQDLPHPRLEAIFTVDEEIGMLGAEGIDVSDLQGRRMLNIDSEIEGVFTVSCAGGCTALVRLPLRREAFSGTALSVTIEGLSGGHSGIEIHKGLANADLLLGRFLAAADARLPLRLIAAEGGLKDNAIPRSARALLVTSEPEAFQSFAQELEAAFRHEYSATDPSLQISVTAENTSLLPMDEDSSRRCITWLSCVPDGVQAMSPHIPGLVQTSLNLGILQTEDNAILSTHCVRSSLDSQKRMLLQRLERLSAALGGDFSTSGDYAGWQYRETSPLRDLLVEVYTRQYGSAPQIEAIHAGVECGIFAGKLPGLDCVSIGPDLTEIHTCREKMSISSVQRLWQMLLEVLRLMKEK